MPVELRALNEGHWFEFGNPFILRKWRDEDGNLANGKTEVIQFDKKQLKEMKSKKEDAEDGVIPLTDAIEIEEYTDEIIQEKVKLRVASGGELEEIGKKYPFEKEYKEVSKDRWESVIVPDEEIARKRKEAIWAYTIEEWLFFDQAGKEVKCTKDMKMKMMYGWPKFTAFIAQRLGLLSGKFVQDEKALQRQYQEELENL